MGQSAERAPDVHTVMPVHRQGPSNPFREFTKDEVEQSIASRFEAQVSLYPERIAIKDGALVLTYAGLNRAANRLARAIVQTQVAVERPVALLIDHGALPVIGVLGVLKAGSSYTPLDGDAPLARNQHVLADCQARLIVTDERNLPLAQELAGAALPVLNVERQDASDAGRNLGLAIPPSAIAAIIYTSGSTGRPKGVVHSQRSLLGITRGFANFVRIRHDDRQALLARFGHVGGALITLRTLFSGAALLPFDLRREDLAGLAQWLAHEDITIYHSTPTVFRRMVSTMSGAEDLARLRIVHLGSEPVLREDVDGFARRFPAACHFCAMYGSTERGNATGCWLPRSPDERAALVPAGYPTDDVELLLLGEGGEEVGPNRVAEVAIASDYLALGYLGMPELTAARFPAHPRDATKRVYRTGDLGIVRSDGCLVLQGRQDAQVKVRGFRIEAGEVENALLTLGLAKECAVTAQTHTGSEPRLVAYLVPSIRPVPSVSAIRRQLAGVLPDHMIPSAFVYLEALPLTASNKLDRRALPAPGKERPELDTAYIAPRTPVEETLATIWAQVLGVEQVGIHDDFFDLGGDSLRAAQVVLRTNQAYTAGMTLARLFAAPTVAAMALLVTQTQAAQVDAQEMERLLAEVEALSADAPADHIPTADGHHDKQQ